MTYCKVISCYNEKCYGQSSYEYCLYHIRCMNKLREYWRGREVENIKAMETFETWFNGNCGYVIGEWKGSRWYIFIVVYEPKCRNMDERIGIITEPYIKGYSVSTKLSNEISESNSKLGYTDAHHWRAREIERQYVQEIPPKKECRIM